MGGRVLEIQLIPKMFLFLWSYQKKPIEALLSCDEFHSVMKKGETLKHGVQRRFEFASFLCKFPLELKLHFQKMMALKLEKTKYFYNKQKNYAFD